MLFPRRRSQRRDASPAFYGWRLAAVGAALNALASGFYGRGFTVYFLDLARDLKLSYTATSLVFGFSALEGGLQSPFTGFLIDRWGPRIMMVCGAALAGVGFLLLPLANNYVSFLLIFVGVVSLGVNAGFHNGSAAVVNRWFVRHRGAAFGLISLGVAIGGSVITPIVAALVLIWGWRTAAVVSGVVFLLVGVPLSAVIRNSPEEVGQVPDGIGSASRRSTSEAIVQSEYTVGQALKTASYWLLATGICLRIAAQSGVMVHIVPLMVWKGLSEATGGGMIATMSLSAVATRPLMGWWGDHSSKRKLVAAAMLVGAGSLVFLVFSPGKLWLMVLFGVAFSVTEGAAGLTWAMVGDYFGVKSFATLRGGVNLIVSLGALTTPVVAGRVFDVTNSYYWVLLPLAGIYVAAAIVFLVLPDPRHPLPKRAGPRLSSPAS